MGTVGYLLLLALSILVAAQCLMLMERHRPVNTRLRDLGYGGDAGLLAMAMTLVGAAIGALIGHAMGTPGVGGALGASVAVVAWLLAVVLAQLRRPGPPRRFRRKGQQE